MERSRTGSRRVGTLRHRRSARRRRVAGGVCGLALRIPAARKVGFGARVIGRAELDPAGDRRGRARARTNYSGSAADGARQAGAAVNFFRGRAADAGSRYPRKIPRAFPAVAGATISRCAHRLDHRGAGPESFLLGALHARGDERRERAVGVLASFRGGKFERGGWHSHLWNPVARLDAVAHPEPLGGWGADFCSRRCSGARRGFRPQRTCKFSSSARHRCKRGCWMNPMEGTSKAGSPRVMIGSARWREGAIFWSAFAVAWQTQRMRSMRRWRPAAAKWRRGFAGWRLRDTGMEEFSTAWTTISASSTAARESAWTT